MYLFKVHEDQIMIFVVLSKNCQLVTTQAKAPQALEKFNPKVNLQTCGIIQKLYEI